MYLPTKCISSKDLVDDVYVIFFSYFLYRTYVLGTNLNCIIMSMQFKLVPTTFALKKKLTKSTLAVSNLKTTESLDSALIGVSVVIRLNTVFLKILGKIRSRNQNAFSRITKGILNNSKRINP